MNDVNEYNMYKYKYNSNDSSRILGILWTLPSSLKLLRIRVLSTVVVLYVIVFVSLAR